MPTSADPYLAWALQAARETTPLPDLHDLPLLTAEVCDPLETTLNNWCLDQPRRAGRLAALVSHAAAATNDPFIQGRAAFMDGLVAQTLALPGRLAASLTRAENQFKAAATPEWITACRWLRLAQPWLAPNFADAAAELLDIRQALAAGPLAHLVPDCTLSLAAAWHLLRRKEKMAEEMAACQAAFAARSPAWEANWLLHALPPALAEGKEAFEPLRQQLETRLAEEPAAFLQAKAHYRFGFADYYITSDLDAAAARFRLAESQFHELGSPVFTAQARQILAQVLTDLGELRQARDYLLLARQTFQEHDIKGLSANNAHDLAYVHLALHDYQTTIFFAREAIGRYDQLGQPAHAAGVHTNLGLALERLGDYQEALRTYEEAQRLAQAFGWPYVEVNLLELLAQLWLKLDQTEQARAALERMSLLEDRPRYKARIRRRTAMLHLQEGRLDAAQAALEEGLTFLGREQDRIERGLVFLDLARLALERGSPSAAFDACAQARSIFTDYALDQELNLCTALTAHAYLQAGDLENALAAAQTALNMNNGQRPDLTWEISLILGGIQHRLGRPEEARSHYVAGLAAAGEMTAAMWQPDLAARFLRQNSKLFDEPLRFLIDAGRPAELFTALQAARYQGLIARLPAVRLAPDREDALAGDLAAEIHQIDGNIKSVTNRLIIHKLNLQRRQKTLAWLDQRRAVERAAAVSPRTIKNVVSNDQLRAILDKRLPGGWLALTYHLLDDEAILHLLAPNHEAAFRLPFPPRERGALLRFAKLQESSLAFLQPDLAGLGERLLPPAVREQLSPDTPLLIAPHGPLFHLPWNALLVDGVHLVERAVPAVIPSWADLAHLWELPAPPRQGRGLALTFSDFQERHAPLPQAAAEGQALQAALPISLIHLSEEAAAHALLDDGSLAGCDFLHLATHTFYDGESGYLGGIALPGEDIWHQRLLQLTAVPPLVSLATCSGLRGFVQAGSAYQGLATTLLAAGARTVIGSLWPVRDGSAVGLITTFYRHWLAGRPPALALALAQRAALGDADETWAGFMCFGAPQLPFGAPS